MTNLESQFTVARAVPMRARWSVGTRSGHSERPPSSWAVVSTWGTLRAFFVASIRTERSSCHRNPA